MRVTTAATCGGTSLQVSGPGDDVAAVAEAMPGACDALASRGLVPGTPPVVVVHDTVDAFVAATGQTVDTLRAWSTPGAVHLLTLEAWQRADDGAVTRRLTHELCHVAIFQRYGDGARRIPRTLGEGLCSVIAEQGGERMPLEEVRRRVAAGEVVDFVEGSPFAYGVAHHVVARIGCCRGRDTLLPLLDAVVGGQSVAEALGAPPLSFLGDCPPPPAAAAPSGSAPATSAVESRH